MNLYIDVNVCSVYAYIFYRLKRDIIFVLWKVDIQSSHATALVAVHSKHTLYRLLISVFTSVVFYEIKVT